MIHLVSGLLLAGAAVAAEPQASATVAWRHGPRASAFVGGGLWRCAGDSCSGPLADRPAARARACRQLARYAGRVLALVTPGGAIDADGLARCNRGLD